VSRILGTNDNYWCEEAVSACGILVDGDDYYRAVFEAGQLAEEYILLAGWQFDTDACLLRGVEAERAALPVSLLAYLNALCEQKPALRIYVLAWDFHVVFALEREWLQDLRFKWLTNERLQFLFDAHHVAGGSHHQKFVVVDGALAFLGGLDLCDHRWDDRRHCVPNALRVSRGEPHRPFHDVQAYLVGAVARRLTELFSARWQAAGGAALTLPQLATPRVGEFQPRGGLPLAATQVALSRVDPYGAPTGAKDCREILQLTLDALNAARQLVYVETQYFSARALGDAFAACLEDTSRPPLSIVLVLNEHAETLKEEIAVGLAQARVIKQLRAAAARGPHRLRIYYTVPQTEPGVEPERATYIHSKLMIVDDRFLMVGSANFTNRSNGLDTELNAAFEADSADTALGRSIRGARQALIAEHLGVPELEQGEDLIELLDRYASTGNARLRAHPSPTATELQALEVIDPTLLPFDPAAPEAVDHDRTLFVGGIGDIWRKLFG